MLIKRIRNRITSWLKSLILTISNTFNIDLVLLGMRENGILNPGDLTKTGEKYVIEKILPKIIDDNQAVLFDVGANIGDYSKELSKNFPNAKIYAFEPNPNPYNYLAKNTKDSNINIYPMALGENPEEGIMFSYKQKENFNVGTFNKEALEIFYKFKDDEIEKIEITIETIDNFCQNQSLNQIDFLKLDIEGHEFKALLGAKKMIAKNMIKVIQFEFNDFDVISRVFLKDFYDLLSSYSFYRTTKRGLLPLGEYDTFNEIFKFQNILAIHKNHVNKVKSL